MMGNVNGIDRIVRVILAVIAIVFAAIVGFGSVGAWILLAVAAILLVTAVIGFCPLYRLVGISTRSRRA